jgi:hypothetical protein
MSPKPQNMARRFDVTSLLFGSSILQVQDHLTTQESATLDCLPFHFVAMSGGIPQRKKGRMVNIEQPSNVLRNRKEKYVST